MQILFSTSLCKTRVLQIYSISLTLSCIKMRTSTIYLVVLFDTVMQHITPMLVRGLLKHLLQIREAWSRSHLSDDLDSIAKRAYRA